MTRPTNQGSESARLQWLWPLLRLWPLRVSLLLLLRESLLRLWLWAAPRRLLSLLLLRLLGAVPVRRGWIESWLCASPCRLGLRVS